METNGRERGKRDDNRVGMFERGDKIKIKRMSEQTNFLADLFWLDPMLHDKQHWWASLAGGILGLGIFVTYYFFSRIEHHPDPKKQKSPGQPKFSWEMPWWYFVVGILLSLMTGMAFGCTLSAAIRKR